MTNQILLPPEQAWTFHRLPTVLAEHHIDPWVVTHIGAHHGEEVDTYRRCRFAAIYLAEADPRSVAVLRERYATDPAIGIIAAAVVAEPGTGPITLHYAERSVWSGVHPHPTATGGTVSVPTVAINELLDTTNVLVLDTQGSELELLRAADLTAIDLVIVETTRRRGDGAAFYDDAVSYMDIRGFTAVEEWVHDTSGYTDTVFVADTA